MSVIERQPFVANAVFIPEVAQWHDHRGRHVDPTECVTLMVSGDNNQANVFTEESWKSDGEPFCYREWGKFTHVDGGKVVLLPELWVIKIDEREHWINSDVLSFCPRIFGVYAFDRKSHHHLCSFEPCYELHFLGSQYDESTELQDDEYLRDRINTLIQDGDAQSDPVTYWGVADIDRMIANKINPGFLPEGENGGTSHLLKAS